MPLLTPIQNALPMQHGAGADDQGVEKATDRRAIADMHEKYRGSDLFLLGRIPACGR